MSLSVAELTVDNLPANLPANLSANLEVAPEQRRFVAPASPVRWWLPGTPTVGGTRLDVNVIQMVVTSPRLLVLHALRCLGSTVPARLATATGLDESGVESELIDLAVAGLAGFERGAFGGWSLTAAGKAADAERIAAELDAAGARPAVTAAYHRFLRLNPEVLDICTAWQTPDGADPAREARVLARLVDVDRRAGPVLADLAAAVPRFGRYRDRLTAALDRVRAGRPEFVVLDLEAYHTVWFQLHEDLLATLGIPR